MCIYVIFLMHMRVKVHKHMYVHVNLHVWSLLQLPFTLLTEAGSFG